MTTENRDLVLLRFSRQLEKVILRKYGKKFSGASFADQYNFRASGTTTISRQTALRWLSGKGFPDPGRLYILVEWLNLDLDAVFRSQKPKTSAQKLILSN